MINIGPASQVHHHFNVLLYADSGVGKTLLSTTGDSHPGMKGTLVINCEDGMLTLSNEPTIDVTQRVRTIQDVRDVVAALYPTGELHGKYQTLVVDGVSELQDIGLAEISGGSEEITLRNYGTSTRQMRVMLRALRNLPMHVIFTCLAKTEYPDEGTEPTNVGPQLTGKVAMQAMALMDHVWHLRIKPGTSGVRELFTQIAGPCQAKTRGVAFAKDIGPLIEDPNLADLYQSFVEHQSATPPRADAGESGEPTQDEPSNQQESK